MKRGSTIFLRGAVLAMAAVVLALCIFVLPVGISEEEMYRPMLLGLYVTAIPFFVAVYQTLKLLGYIDKNKAFAGRSVKALEYIKYCAISISVLYAAGIPLLYIPTQKDDAPGILALGLVIIFAAAVIAVFAAVLQKLLQNAIDIKSENDLTV